MFFFSFGGGMVMHMGSGPMGMGPGGPTMMMGGGGPPSSSTLGSEFDDYVEKFVPSSSFPLSPRWRTIDDLWTNRRLRIYQNSNTYKEGRVVQWEQRGSGPFNRSTKWKLTIEYDWDGGDNDSNGNATTGSGVTIERDDIVVIQEFPKKHKGKKGIVVNPNVSKNNMKCKIKLLPSDDDAGPHDNLPHFITVKKEQLKVQKTYPVHRMNVTGGGILVQHVVPSNNHDYEMNLEDNRTFLSLEWIDRASPSASLLYQGGASNGMMGSANCPTCRAVEPTYKAFDDDVTKVTDLTSNHNCPVCTETKPCRVLQCRHAVCMECWNQWRHKSTTKIPSSVTPPTTSRDRLQRDRDRNFQKLRGMLPHTLGGTATKAEGRRRSSEEDITKAYERFNDKMESLVRDLYKNAEGEEDEESGLTKYWKKLMTVSLHLFRLGAVDKMVRDLDSIPALEIAILVTKSREDEISSRDIGLPEDDRDDGQGCVDYLIHRCCNRIGEILEGRYDDHRSATHWYERAILHAKRTLEQETSDDNKGELAMKYNNLALAQKRSGQLTKAMTNYDTAMEHFPADIDQDNKDVVESNKRSLQSEMKQWTGTSGKLTPGC